MPKSPLRHVHFIAIGGTGMGSLAGLLASRGLEITGSDVGLYPPMSTALERWGIPVQEGFRPGNVLERRPDLVVIGNAVRPDNPEARAAIDSGLRHLSFPDALYELAIAGKHCLTVAGTHGKTTTSSLCAYLLHATGRDPSLLVGGISLDFDGSFRDGSGEHFVVEGDEYDTAFFDKTPKFLHYHPRTLIITSIEFDHADIYRDLAHVKSAFRELVDTMPADATIVAAWNHANVRDVVSGAPCRVLRYGIEGAPAAHECEWLATSVRSDVDGTRFGLRASEAGEWALRMPLYGDFNVENALAALAANAVLGVSPEESTRRLAGFRGVKRRQEIRGEAAGVSVVDDFAHHPTAVRGSIAALRARFPGRRLIAVFEPRTNTSRRRLFQQDYVGALEGADAVFVREVPEDPIYSATGEVHEFFSAPQLCRDLRERGVSARSFARVDEIVDAIVADRQRGDVVLIMSNGSFEGIWERLLVALEADQTG